MRALKLVYILAFAVFLFSSCSNSGSYTDTSSNTQKKQLYVNPLTGISSEDPSVADKRPIAIMINNIRQALPQYGISSADMWYETLAEGGITRIMGVFSDVNTIPKTGPVRSVRDYYIDLMNPLNAILVHFGGSPKGYETISQMKINNIDGMTLSDLSFIQDKNLAVSRGREHSFFVTSEGILKGIGKNNYSTSIKINPVFNFVGLDNEVLPNGNPANIVDVTYSHSASARFEYDVDTKKYKKFQNGAKHIDANDNNQIEVDNIFVLKADIQPIKGDASNRVSVDLKSGSGHYISKGFTQDIKFTKDNSTKQFVFKDFEGNIIEVNRGKTWVCIVPLSQNVSIK